MADHNAPRSPRPEVGGTRGETTQGGFASALLLGSDHTELGEVTIQKISPNLAIGITRGRFPKGYPHLDPNEDAVYAATDGHTVLLAVADGHHGIDAARATITAIARSTPVAMGEPPATIVSHLAAAAIEAVATIIPHLPPPRDTSRTSLTISAVDDTTMASATFGDTSCYVTTRRKVVRIGAESGFLSPGSDPTSLVIVTRRAPQKGGIVATSDGLVDFAPDLTTTLRSTLNLTSSESADLLIKAAFAGGAGDNVAIAVCRRP